MSKCSISWSLLVGNMLVWDAQMEMKHGFKWASATERERERERKTIPKIRVNVGWDCHVNLNIHIPVLV